MGKSTKQKIHHHQKRAKQFQLSVSRKAYLKLVGSVVRASASVFSVISLVRIRSFEIFGGKKSVRVLEIQEN